MKPYSPSASTAWPVVIVLAGAPMGKERVRFSRATGRTFTPERTVNYESRLALAAQNVMAGRPLLDGPLAVDIIANMPIAASWPKKRQAAALAGTERPTKKPDWDNFGKILDALNLVVWADDAQIVDGRVQKFYSAAPSLTVRVRQIGADDVSKVSEARMQLCVGGGRSADLLGQKVPGPTDDIFG